MTNLPNHQDVSLYDRLRLNPEIVIDETLNEVRSYLKILLERINTPEKDDNIGLILESLVRILLESPYLKFNRARRVCKAGEIDLDFTVKKFPTTLFEEFDIFLIVECKNWKVKPGAPELRVFRDKMREVGSKVGIFIAKQGVTKPSNTIVRDAWISEGIIIIVFDKTDLERIILKSENFYTILKDKYLSVRASSKE